MDTLQTIILILVVAYFIANMSFLKKTITSESNANKKKKENFRKSFPTHIKRNSMIQLLLEKIVFDLKGTKAYVLQYHNGGESAFGIPFAKLSMTNEYCPVGIDRELPMYQNLPLSIWAPLSLAANKNNFLCIPDVCSVTDGAASTFIGRGVKSAYIEHITSIEGDPLGLIVFESMSGLCLDSEAVDHFRCLCAKICGLIMCKDVSMDDCTNKECEYNAPEQS